jgi:hypothetical protein
MAANPVPQDNGKKLITQPYFSFHFVGFKRLSIPVNPQSGS